MRSRNERHLRVDGILCDGDRCHCISINKFRPWVCRGNYHTPADASSVASETHRRRFDWPLWSIHGEYSNEGNTNQSKSIRNGFWIGFFSASLSIDYRSRVTAWWTSFGEILGRWEWRHSLHCLPAGIRLLPFPVTLLEGKFLWTDSAQS